MAQNYLWKVEYRYSVWNGHYYEECKRSKLFRNKLNAMQFVNSLENSYQYSGVKLKKWFG